MRIYVDTEEEKQKLINESLYIHDFYQRVYYKVNGNKVREKIVSLDSDKAGTLMHIYMAPEIIVVRQKG